MPAVQTDAAPRTTDRARSSLLAFLVSWVVLGVLAIGWAVATPIAASPDEPAHMVKAASVARGELIGDWSDLGQVVQVPLYIAYTHSRTCTAFEPGISADCQVEIGGDTSGLVPSTTTAGLYNPLYYAAVGWPTLFIGDAGGVYAMRIVSAMLSTLFLALAVGVAWGLRSRALPLIGLAISAPPMVFFLSGSVNPNALETTSTLAAFVAMMAIVRQPDPARIAARSIVLIAAAVVALNTRSLSPLWVLLAIAIPLVLAGWPRIRELLRDRWVISAIIAVGIGALLAVGWTLYTALLPSQNAENFQEYPGEGLSPISGFVHMIRETFGYAQAMIANFGWLDTPAPLIVYFSWAVLSGVLVFGGLAILRGRALIGLAVLALAFVVVPAALQGFYVTSGGFVWQGRYNLALFALLCYGAAQLLAEHLDRTGARLSARAFAFAWIGWGCAQATCFAIALQRYAVGADGTWAQVIGDPDWSAPGGNVLWLAVGIVVPLGIAALGFAVGTLRDPARRAAIATPAPSTS